MFWSDDSVCAVSGAQHARYELALDQAAWTADTDAATLPDGQLVDRRRKTIDLGVLRRRRTAIPGQPART